ncbi:hemoglobin/transferrin/lactoferrin receptor protein [Gillisia mitskevichiae]|uniref:Hemoglobin/transferrin/lactoferrin receptor protein n=1 Tax=Gillisia mitskevichiae TaxID=270921 RepID=A0A495PYJ5_9FLAO|nr:TonB-dependent receptor [Gillisia mitskevichiae]RKS55493.1 hemoglobin/transferrin/lactoferrin receptor protein [Gillisia mitskevichiae]
MRSIFTSLFTLLFFTLSFQAQEIKILDQATNDPIGNVAIFNLNKSKSVLSNFNGEADISKFSIDEKLIFQHVSHLEKSILKSELAQDLIIYLEEDETMLQEVVLSIAKFEQDKKEIPQRIVSLSSEDIAFSNVQTSADLMESSGGVYVQKSQLGGGSPMIRGFSTNRLLIAVDGVRMNTAIFRSGNIQNIISIDPLSVDNAEIILGPGSVVYGSDAIGGVMNFYTLKPKRSSIDDLEFTANAYARVSSANEEKTTHADFNIGLKKWAFLSSISYSDFGDLKMGSHGPEEFLRPNYVSRVNGEDLVIVNKDPKKQVPTGYNQINLLQKVAFVPNEIWDFSLGLIYSNTSNYPRYDRLVQKKDGNLRYANWYYGPQSWFMGNATINKKGNGKLYDKLQFTGAYQNFEESRLDRKFGNEILYSTKEEVNAYSANLDLEKDFEKNKLFYGLEYVANKVNSTGESKNILTEELGPNASRYPDDAIWQSLAAYLSYNWKLRDNLNLQSGVRYNYIMIEAKFPSSEYDFPFNDANLNTGAFTGSAGLSWQQNDKLDWKINFSTAFRAPNIDDIGKIFDSEPGAVVVPNPDLKPEYAYNGELSLGWKPTKKIRFDLATFYTYLEDALVRRDYSMNGNTSIDYQGEPSRIQAIQNAANAYVYGFEGGVELEILRTLKLKSQITITKGKEEQDNGEKAPLRHAAPLYGNTHLVYNKGKFKLDLFSEYNGKLDFDELAPSEQDKDYLYALDRNGNPYFANWYTLNITGNYRFSEHWNATASVENITDQRYRTYSSGISSAGRNFILALRYSL